VFVINTDCANMSISKLFVKVFNEDIFEHLEQDNYNSDLEDDFDGGNCSTVPAARVPMLSELSVTKYVERTVVNGQKLIYFL